MNQWHDNSPPSYFVHFSSSSKFTHPSLSPSRASSLSIGFFAQSNGLQFAPLWMPFHQFPCFCDTRVSDRALLAALSSSTGSEGLRETNRPMKMSGDVIKRVRNIERLDNEIIVGVGLSEKNCRWMEIRSTIIRGALSIIVIQDRNTRRWTNREDRRRINYCCHDATRRAPIFGGYYLAESLDQYLIIVPGLFIRESLSWIGFDTRSLDW